MVKLILSENTMKDAMSLIDDFIKDCEINSEKSIKVRLVFEELAANVFQHAKLSSSTYLNIGLSKDDDEINIIMKYDGEPFDPVSYREKDEPDITKKRLGGSGLIIVRQMSKSIEYIRKEMDNVVSVCI